MAKLRDDGWRFVADYPDGELSVHLTPDRNGRNVVTGICLTNNGITSADLRAIPLNRLENTFNADSSDVELPPLVRPRGCDPDEFSELVARHYRQWASRTNHPAQMMADQSEIPVRRVHYWIREARLRGKLPPGQRGKATS